jgi:hypothetical protein
MEIHQGRPTTLAVDDVPKHLLEDRTDELSFDKGARGITCANGRYLCCFTNAT